MKISNKVESIRAIKDLNLNQFAEKLIANRRGGERTKFFNL